MKIVVIIPTYNEEGNIKDLLEALLLEFEKNNAFTFEILVIDGHSADQTKDIVNKLADIYPSIHLVENEKRGLGKAFISGYNYAIKNLKPDIIVQMDSDFSHSPSDLERLISPIFEGADVVVGSRYVKDGSTPENQGIHRKLISFTSNMFAKYIVGLKGTSDCTSGFKAIKSSLAGQIIPQINSNGYFFQVEYLFLAQKKSAKIVEIPINFQNRKAGKSKIRIIDIAEYIYNSFKLRIQSFKQLP